MSVFAGRSLIIDYWQFTLPIVITLLIFAYLKLNRKSDSKNHVSKGKQKLDGEEYIGEYPNEIDSEEDKFTPALDHKDHVSFLGATVFLEGGVKRFYEIISNRRSVRYFSSKPVPFEIIEECVKCAGTSPSGAHTEPWIFCAVSDPTIKAGIREIIEAEEYLNYTQRMHKQWTADLKPLQTYHVKEYLTMAPYLILVFKQIHGMRKDGKKKQHYYNEISVSIATGILLCALQAAGLNSLVTTPLNCGPALRNLLNRPQNEKLLVLLPVGYSAADCKVPNLQRKDVNDILIKY